MMLNRLSRNVRVTLAVVAAGLLVLLVVAIAGLLLPGCATTFTKPPSSPAGAKPLAPGSVTDAAPGAPIDQQGGVNAAIGTGVSVQQAMPVGLVVLLGWLMWLSHRREMLRIRGPRPREPPGS